MKKILILLVLLSCMVVYGEESTYNRYEKLQQELKMSNAGSIDWGPYMRDVQETIKQKWYPPRPYSINKNLVTRFIVEKDGSISDIEVYKSSGESKYDNEAVKTLEKISRFKPLPKKFNGNALIIEFTFDLNVRNSVEYASDKCQTKFCKFFYEHQ